MSLSVCPGARCIVDDVPYLNGASVQDFSAYVRADLRARAELVRMSQLSMPRMYLYYTCLTARYVFAQITQRLGRAA